MIRAALPAAVVLAGALAGCASGERPWPATGRPAQAPAIPDVPDAFRAELRGGRAPGCPLRGNAVNLGEGRFLTSAHLVDGIVPTLRRCAGTPIPTTIHYAGRVLPVRLMRVGEGHVEPGVGPLYRRGEDLALLQAATVPPGPAARPCAEGPAPGQAVLVLSARRRQAARAGAMVPERRAADGAYADLALPLAEGESGAGVFDAASHCLVGLVSHRPDAEPERARMVPAGTIRSFLGG